MAGQRACHAEAAASQAPLPEMPAALSSHQPQELVFGASCYQHMNKPDESPIMSPKLCLKFPGKGGTATGR